MQLRTFAWVESITRLLQHTGLEISNKWRHDFTPARKEAVWHIVLLPVLKLRLVCGRDWGFWRIFPLLCIRLETYFIETTTPVLPNKPSWVGPGPATYKTGENELCLIFCLSSFFRSLVATVGWKRNRSSVKPRLVYTQSAVLDSAIDSLFNWCGQQGLKWGGARGGSAPPTSDMSPPTSEVSRPSPLPGGA
jgi:hypothetical protein